MYVQFCDFIDFNFHFPNTVSNSYVLFVTFYDCKVCGGTENNDNMQKALYFQIFTTLAFIVWELASAQK